MDKNYDDFDGFTINLFLDEDGDYLAHLVETSQYLSVSDRHPPEALVELNSR